MNIPERKDMEEDSVSLSAELGCPRPHRTANPSSSCSVPPGGSVH